MIRIFHISEDYLHNKILKPRVPNNFFTKNGYENNKTKRVCFSTLIHGCLMGISYKYRGKEFYVHEPTDYSKIQIEQITTEDVPDCNITKEVWVLNDVELRCIGKIKVGRATNKDHTFNYGNRVERLYEWDYEFFNIDDDIYENVV